MGIMLDYVTGKLTDEVIFLQLAEEAAELSAACAKMARIIDGRNPSSKSYDEALADVVEEFTDVNLAAEAAGIAVDTDIKEAKLLRWAKRLRGDYNG